MPLIERDYYTYREAIDLINEAHPGEDALTYLQEALSTPFPNQVLIGWVVSEKSGERWQIPAEAIRSKDDFRLDPKTGQARVRIRGLVSPLVVTGPIEIRRNQLDDLLRRSNQTTPSVRKQEDRKAATEQRNAEIQIAAEKIWKTESSGLFNKAEVAAHLLNKAKSDEALQNLLQDHKKRDGGLLAEDTLRRLISEPDWVREKRSKQKVIQKNIPSC